MRNRCLQPLLSCLKAVVSSPLGCFSFRPNQSSSSPDGYFLNSGSLLLLSFSPHQTCIFLKALLPKTGPGIRAEQGRGGCHTDRAPVAVQLHRSQITQHRWPRLTPRIPRSSPHKVLPVPCPQLVPVIVPASMHSFVHFYWIASYFIQTAFWLCQVRSELQPRLPKPPAGSRRVVSSQLHLPRAWAFSTWFLHLLQRDKTMGPPGPPRCLMTLWDEPPGWGPAVSVRPSSRSSPGTARGTPGEEFG